MQTRYTERQIKILEDGLLIALTEQSYYNKPQLVKRMWLHARPTCGLEETYRYVQERIDDGTLRPVLTLKKSILPEYTLS